MHATEDVTDRNSATFDESSYVPVVTALTFGVGRIVKAQTVCFFTLKTHKIVVWKRIDMLLRKRTHACKIKQSKSKNKMNDNV